MENIHCPKYKDILDRYATVASPILEELKNHVRDCPICQKYILDSRDDFALKLIGISDDDLLRTMRNL